MPVVDWATARGFHRRTILLVDDRSPVLSQPFNAVLGICGLQVQHTLALDLRGDTQALVERKIADALLALPEETAERPIHHVLVSIGIFRELNARSTGDLILHALNRSAAKYPDARIYVFPPYVDSPHPESGVEYAHVIGYMERVFRHLPFVDTINDPNVPFCANASCLVLYKHMMAQAISRERVRSYRRLVHMECRTRVGTPNLFPLLNVGTEDSDSESSTTSEDYLTGNDGVEEAIPTPRPSPMISAARDHGSGRSAQSRRR